MNETEANGVGDYKLKRSGEPTGFMKRFKETPPVIFGTDPNEFERRWIAHTETYLYTIRDYIRHVFGDEAAKRVKEALVPGETYSNATEAVEWVAPSATAASSSTSKSQSGRQTLRLQPAAPGVSPSMR